MLPLAMKERHLLKADVSLSFRQGVFLRRRAVVDPSACVACGCCVKVCPLQAIEIVRGVMAQVRQDKCVGCGKCARECPASVIKIREVEA